LNGGDGFILQEKRRLHLIETAVITRDVSNDELEALKLKFMEVRIVP